MNAENEGSLQLLLDPQLPILFELIHDCLEGDSTKRCTNAIAVRRLREGIVAFLTVAKIPLETEACIDMCCLIGELFCKRALNGRCHWSHVVSEIPHRFVPNLLTGDLSMLAAFSVLTPVKSCHDCDSPLIESAAKLRNYIADCGLREHFVNME